MNCNDDYDFSVFDNINELTNFPYSAMAKTAGIKWDKFREYRKSGYVPVKQAFKIIDQVTNYFSQYEEYSKDNLMLCRKINNIDRHGEVYRKKNPIRPAGVKGNKFYDLEDIKNEKLRKFFNV